MAKDFAKAFYKKNAWLKCRQSYIQERIAVDGGMCEECHKQLGYIVHHKILLTPENITMPEVSLNHNHLGYVCKDCHDEYDGHGVGNKKIKPLVMFDSSGQPISLREIDHPP